MFRFFPVTKEKLIALVYGIVCHCLFILAAILMSLSLFSGFSWQVSLNSGSSLTWINLFLLIQFPFFHSLLLMPSGKRILRIFSSSKLNNKLDTTVYAAIASFQLIILFLFWQSTGKTFWVAENSMYTLLTIGHIIGWFALAVSSTQAGFQLQTGSLGWTSMYMNKKVKFPDMPTHGVFRIVRQPIYLSFCIILWVSPYFTLDKLIVATAYTVYCFFAPLLKEKRFTLLYGERFRSYQRNTPYFFPNLSSFFK